LRSDFEFRVTALVAGVIPEPVLVFVVVVVVVVIVGFAAGTLLA